MDGPPKDQAEADLEVAPVQLAVLDRLDADRKPPRTRLALLRRRMEKTRAGAMQIGRAMRAWPGTLGSSLAGILIAAAARSTRTAHGVATNVRAMAVRSFMWISGVTTRGLRAVARAVTGIPTSIVRSVGPTLGAAASGARRAFRAAAYPAGAVALVLLAVFGWLESPTVPSPHELREARSDTTATRPRVATPAPPARSLDHASEVLQDPSTTEDAKLAVVEKVAEDPGDAATGVLVAALGNDSLLVSMASTRALRGRSCDRLTAPLVQQLDDAHWERRAWAAKVLGENGCVAAAPDLRRRLAHERDERVRRQLSTALAMADARAAR